MNTWLKDRKIKAFFSVTQDESFSVGAKNCMNLVGIGKCTVVVFGGNISSDKIQFVFQLKRLFYVLLDIRKADSEHGYARFQK